MSSVQAVVLTTRQRIINMLEDNGLSSKQAIEVMSLVIPHLNSITPKEITFDDDSNEYPDVAYNFWFESMKQVVYDFIHKNYQNSWFLSKFSY